MLCRAFLLAAVTCAGVQPAFAGSVSFTDTFTPTASAQWQDNTGSWYVTPSNTYRASVPNNAPIAYSALPFDLTDFTVSFDTVVGDGGVFLRSDAGNRNGVLLVLGGYGYGQGARGGAPGNSVYFHVITDGSYSAPVDGVSGVLTPGATEHVEVDVAGDTYSVLVGGTLVDTLTTDAFSHGMVALYDDQPNTASGGGSGTPTTFADFALSGTTTAVPEPSGTGVLLGGVLLAGLFARRTRG